MAGPSGTKAPIEVDSTDDELEWVDVPVKGAPKRVTPAADHHTSSMANENAAETSDDDIEFVDVTEAARPTPARQATIKVAPPHSSPEKAVAITKEAARTQTQPKVVKTNSTGDVVKRDYAEQPSCSPPTSLPPPPVSLPTDAFVRTTASPPLPSTTSTVPVSAFTFTSAPLTPSQPASAPSIHPPVDHSLLASIAAAVSEPVPPPSPASTLPLAASKKTRDDLAAHDTAQSSEAAPSAAPIQRDDGDVDKTDLEAAADKQMEDVAPALVASPDAEPLGSDEEIPWSRSPSPVARPPHQVDTAVPEDFPLLEQGHELTEVDEDEDDVAAREAVFEEQNHFSRLLTDLATRNLDEMREEARNEVAVLGQQRKKDRRAAEEITQQMAKEIQVRCRSFGGRLQLRRWHRACYDSLASLSSSHRWKPKPSVPNFLPDSSSTASSPTIPTSSSSAVPVSTRTCSIRTNTSNATSPPISNANSDSIVIPSFDSLTSSVPTIPTAYRAWDRSSAWSS